LIISINNRAHKGAYTFLISISKLYNMLKGIQKSDFSSRLKTVKGVILTIFCLLCFLESNAINFTSATNGDWDKGATWGNSGNDVEGSGYPGSLDNATITSGKTVQVKFSQTVNDITINSGGVLTTSNNRTLTVLGNYIVNGTHTGGVGSKVTFSGSSKSISGIGTISLPGGISLSTSRSVLSSANLIIASDFNMLSTVTLTNNGKVTIIAPFVITAAAAGPTWINAANSTLLPGGTTNVLNNVTLDASATGNTVDYYQETSQNIKIPTGNTYYNLHMTGVGTKSLIGNIVAMGNVFMDGATLSMSSFTLTVQGDWENEGSLSGTGTVIFSGSNDQTLTSTSGELFYNMTMSKTSGILTLANNVAVSNSLNMSGGEIDGNLNTLTIGTSTSTLGSLTYTAGFLYNGKIERWVNATGINMLFPLGVVYGSYYTPIYISFNNLSTSGSIVVEFPTNSTTNNGLPLSDNGKMVYNTFGTGYYTLTPQNGLVSNNYNVQAAGLPFFNMETSTRILTRADSISNWTANGTHQAADLVNGLAKRANISILPAELTLADTANCSVPVTSAITGPTNVCINSTQTYSVTNTGNFFTWIIQGGTQSSGGNTNSITIDWGSTGTDALIIVVEANACGTGLPVLSAVTISPTTLTSITGKTYAPENTTVGNEESYSITAAPGYTYAWAITGGTIVSGAATSSVSVRWGAAGAGQISVGITNGCGTSTIVKPVSIYVVINSIQSGNWNSTSTWDCNCVPSTYNSVRVRNPHTVTFPNSNLTITNLISDIGGIFNNTNSSKSLTVTGDLLMNGTYSGSSILIHDGTGSIDGIGTISTSGSLSITGGSKDILSSCVLSRTSGTIDISSGITINNYGVFTTSGNITGGASSSTWINQAASTLNIGGSFLTTGTVVVNTVPNTVEYTGSASQNIVLTDYYDLFSSGTGARVLPSSGTVGIAGAFQPGTNAYTITGSTIDINGTSAQDVPGFTFNNLTVSGGDVKTMTGAVTCNGAFLIQSGTEFDLSGNALVCKGNFTNDGTFTHSGGSTTFNGTSLQTLSGLTTTFNDFTLNNSAGMTLGISANINNNLTVTSGALGFGSTAINVDVIGNVSGAGSINMTGGGLAHTLTFEGASNTIGAFTTTNGSGSTVTYNYGGSQTIMAAGYQHLVLGGSGTKTAAGATTINGNLTIGTGLTLADAGYTLTVKGNITNNGIHSGTGEILLSGGSASHTLSGGTFGNMELNDANGASAASATIVTNILTLTAGTLASGGNLTVNLNTGAIAGTGSGAISGNITTIKTVNSSKYHEIACPLTGLTANDWNDNITIKSGAYANLFSYDETNTDTTVTTGWTAQTSLSTPLTSMKGFALYFYGATTLDQTGAYTHSASYTNPTLTNTVSNTGGTPKPSSDGWNLMGNPYPSALDWNAATGWTRTGLDNAIYIWDAVNSRYTSYVGGSGTNGGTQYVPSMQAFWVRVSSPGTGSLAMTNSVRVTSTNPSIWRTAGISDILTLTASSGDYSDETIIRFKDGAQEIFDSQLDAYKMDNEDYTPSLYTELNHEQYSINSLPYSSKNTTIPVKLAAAFSGAYTFTADETASFQPGDSIIFEDRRLGVKQDLRSNPSYTCSVTAGDTSGRFYISFREGKVSGFNSPVIPSMTIKAFDDKIDIQFFNENSAAANIQIYNMLGEPVFKVDNADISSKEYTIRGANPQNSIYIVKVMTDSQTFSQKVYLFK
jgi:hypothetical protein